MKVKDIYFGKIVNLSGNPGGKRILLRKDMKPHQIRQLLTAGLPPSYIEADEKELKFFLTKAVKTAQFQAGRVKTTLVPAKHSGPVVVTRSKEDDANLAKLTVIETVKDFGLSEKILNGDVEFLDKLPKKVKESLFEAFEVATVEELKEKLLV